MSLEISHEHWGDRKNQVFGHSQISSGMRQLQVTSSSCESGPPICKVMNEVRHVGLAQPSASGPLGMWGHGHVGCPKMAGSPKQFPGPREGASDLSSADPPSPLPRGPAGSDGVPFLLPTEILKGLSAIIIEVNRPRSCCAKTSTVSFSSYTGPGRWAPSPSLFHRWRN